MRSARRPSIGFVRRYHNEKTPQNVVWHKAPSAHLSFCDSEPFFLQFCTLCSFLLKRDFVEF